MGKSVWDYIAPIAGSALAIGLGQPELLGLTGAGGLLGTAGTAAIGAGIGSGLNTGIKTGNPLTGLVSGVAGGAGSYAGSELLGPALGGIGSTSGGVSGATTPGFMGTPIASSLSQLGGEGAGDALNPSSSLASTVFGQATPGSAIGGAIGGSVANNAAQSAMPSLFTDPTLSSGPAGFSPSKQDQASLPGSLSSYSGLNPQQQASNLATQGVYGGGNGPQETNYFLNQVNRQLFDQNGNVASNMNLPPVELSYLNQLGISGSSPTDYLKGISQYGT